ncbi:MAG: hypothetical protein M3404_01905 [Actinomycetota bacterium]|nr:hypothetical protein [Actinomycetota bacterium]
MSRRPNAEDVRRMGEVVTVVVGKLRADADVLERFAKQASRGYPTSTRSEGVRGHKQDGPVLSAVLAKVGAEEEARSSGKEILTTMTPEEKADRLLRDIDAVFKALIDLDHRRGEVVPMTKEEAQRLTKHYEEFDLWCQICARFGFQEPIRANGRCSACQKWRERHSGQDSPEDVVRARHQRRVRKD